MRTKLLLVMSLALSLAMVVSACAEDQPAITAEAEEGESPGDEGAAQDAVIIGGEEAANHGSEDVTGVSELELDDFYFEPTVLEGEAGQSLNLTLFNEGDAAHTFTIDGVVDEELQPGDEGVTAEVTFPDSGALVFYCRFHRGQGMLGALSVGGSLETSGSGGMTTDGGSEGPGYGGYG